MKQLVLDLALPEPEPFTDFIPGDNAEALFQLWEWACDSEQAHFIHFWGATGSGKSHLLQATAARINQPYLDARHQPLPEHLTPDHVLIVDHVDALSPSEQVRLFDHFNTLRECHGRMLTASTLPPNQLHILPDLASRLGWGLVFQIKLLDDIDRAQALQTQARQLGFDLTPELSDYLLRHASRDLPSLYQLLKRLNEYSLAEHRPITLALLRRVMA